MNITVVIDDASIAELAKRITDYLGGAYVTLANAGMIAPDQPPFVPDQPAASQPDPWGAPSQPQASGYAQPQPQGYAQPAPPQNANGYAQQPQPATAAFAPGATQASPAPASPDVITLKTQSGVQVWHMNTPGAPLCGHGQPAGKVNGTSAKTGKAWAAYRCALGAGDQWRNKCDFSQWA